MKKTLALTSIALLALSACDKEYGTDLQDTASPAQYAGKSCSELATLRSEYEAAGQVLSTNDNVNAAQAVGGVAVGVAGAPVVGAAIAADAIGEDQTEQQVRAGGQAQYHAIMTAGRDKGCWT